MHKILAILLAPFSLLYGLGVSLHQALYASGIIKSVKFSIPVISIGNLSVGGTGKSPHVEYLIRLLSPYIPLALLSRGYNRNTSGYILLNGQFGADQTGDEPFQIKSKFPEIPVAVSESRALGIPKIISQFPETKLILLDDAFQHLQVKPSLQILLTEYKRPYIQDFLLPSGRLREWRFGAERADVVIVSKCPDPSSEPDEQYWRKLLRLRASQQLYFSFIDYGIPYLINNPQDKYYLNPSLHVLMVSAVAQSEYLENYVSEYANDIDIISYEDHHYFSEKEISEWKEKFDRITTSNKMILTTEKDATRLLLHQKFLEAVGLKIYVIPIEVKFYQKDMFDKSIKDFLLDFKS